MNFYALSNIILNIYLCKSQILTFTTIPYLNLSHSHRRFTLLLLNYHPLLTSLSHTLRPHVLIATTHKMSLPLTLSNLTQYSPSLLSLKSFLYIQLIQKILPYPIPLVHLLNHCSTSIQILLITSSLSLQIPLSFIFIWSTCIKLYELLLIFKSLIQII